MHTPSCSLVCSEFADNLPWIWKNVTQFPAQIPHPSVFKLNVCQLRWSSVVSQNGLISWKMFDSSKFDHSFWGRHLRNMWVVWRHKNRLFWPFSDRLVSIIETLSLLFLLKYDFWRKLNLGMYLIWSHSQLMWQIPVLQLLNMKCKDEGYGFGTFFEMGSK